VPPRETPRRPQRLVTLTTDIGWAYAAQMKGVLARSLPPGRVVDLTHEVPRHAVPEAAFILRSIAERFPAGTVHVAVVDPGVGGRRAPLIIATRDGSRLVGPDNGVLAPLAHRLGRPRAFRIDPDRVRGGPRVGTTFDGRDLFAPTAALLARGSPPSSLGIPHRFVDLALPQPRRTADGARGEVVHRDAFGNLITNVPTEWLPRADTVLRLFLGRARPRPLPRASSYEGLGPGHLGVLGSSFGTLELAVAEGRADRRLRADAGTPVRFAWSSAQRRPRH
jgi:S-adenosyl-L-methionine hydrolase (adenosine-forming)